MLFPALPWEPCLYYDKAQPRSFLGQTSAAGHLLIVPSPEHRDREEGSAFQRRQQQQQQRSPARNLVCLSRECGRACLGGTGLQTAVHPEPCEHRSSGDSPCVCPWAGSPPGSRGADVIHPAALLAGSEQPRGEGWTRFPLSLPRSRSAVLPGRAPGWLRRQQGW